MARRWDAEMASYSCVGPKIGRSPSVRARAELASSLLAVSSCVVVSGSERPAPRRTPVRCREREARSGSVSTSFPPSVEVR